MGWSIGFDNRWQRDIGYGVPAICDHPGCEEKIDRGLSYVCCGEEPYGGDDGCGLYFCEKHHSWMGRKCERCHLCEDWFKPKPDTKEWLDWKLTDESWQEWRASLDTGEVRDFIYTYQDGRCISCNVFVTKKQAHLHEKVFRGKGGKISLDNSEILCKLCHLDNKVFGHGKRKPQFRGGKDV